MQGLAIITAKILFCTKKYHAICIEEVHQPRADMLGLSLVNDQFCPSCAIQYLKLVKFSLLKNMKQLQVEVQKKPKVLV
jgi:hypothetical protein